jgi:hypothetical protein
MDKSRRGFFVMGLGSVPAAVLARSVQGAPQEALDRAAAVNEELKRREQLGEPSKLLIGESQLGSLKLHEIDPFKTYIMEYDPTCVNIEPLVNAMETARHDPGMIYFVPVVPRMKVDEFKIVGFPYELPEI